MSSMLFFGKKSATDLKPPAGSAAKAKQRVRILVIDDDANSFPIELLKNEGYAIDYWEKVKDLSKLEEGYWDIIFLDIGGVALDWSAEDGVGILEHLKQVNPGQVVVAFSGQSFDLSKRNFFKLADDMLAKPVEATKCKVLIDNLIVERLTIQHYWTAIATLLDRAGVPTAKAQEIEDRVVRALQRGSKKDALEAVNTLVEHGETAGRVVTIIGKIAALLSLA